MCEARKKTCLHSVQSVNKYLLGVPYVSWLHAVCLADCNAVSFQDGREGRLAGSKQLDDIRRQYVRRCYMVRFQLYACPVRNEAEITPLFRFPLSKRASSFSPPPRPNSCSYPTATAAYKVLKLALISSVILEMLHRKLDLLFFKHFNLMHLDFLSF